MTFRPQFKKVWVGVAVLVCGLMIFETRSQDRTLVAATASATDVSEPHYQEIGYVPRLFAAYTADDGTIYGIEDHFVYRSTDHGYTFKQVGVLPEKDTSTLSLVKERIARSRLVRLLRRPTGPRNLVVLHSGTVLVLGAGSIYRSADQGRTFTVVLDLAAQGIHQPFPVGTAVTPDDLVYFGEHVAGSGKHAIRILEGRADGTEWRVVHTFPAGEIRHVHSIQYDRYRDWLWVCTGDSAEQAQLLYTADRFETLERLGGGTQDWRIVSLMITPEYLYWGSDNGTATGATIFRWDFDQTRLQPLQYIGKPAYFSTILKDGTLVLSTTYEGGSPYSRHADPEPTSEIWMSRNGIDWRSVVSVPTETRNPRYDFGRATIAFPGGALQAKLIYSLTGTSVGNYTTRVASVSEYAPLNQTVASDSGSRDIRAELPAETGGATE